MSRNMGLFSVICYFFVGCWCPKQLVGKYGIDLFITGHTHLDILDIVSAVVFSHDCHCHIRCCYVAVALVVLQLLLFSLLLLLLLSLLLCCCCSCCVTAAVVFIVVVGLVVISCCYCHRCLVILILVIIVVIIVVVVVVVVVVIVIVFNVTAAVCLSSPLFATAEVAVEWFPAA